MTRNFKAFGLAAVAALALSALAASAAQATNHHLTVPTEPSIITAKEEAAAPIHLVTGGGELRCKGGVGAGTVSEKTVAEGPGTATLQECTNETTGQAATVTTNHCGIRFNGETDANGDAGGHLECGGEAEVVIHTKIFFSECTIDIKPQTPKGGAHYTQTVNSTTEKTAVTSQVTLSGIKYTITPASFPCNEFGNGEDGELAGAVTAEAFTEKAGCSALTGTERTTPGNYYNECENAVQDLGLTTT